MRTPFYDQCWCHWGRDEDGRPECEVGSTCECLIHCVCEDCGGNRHECGCDIPEDVLL